MAFQDYMPTVFGLIQTGLISWFVIRMTSHIDKSDRRHQEHDDRDDIQDDLHTLVIGRRFNSARIAKGEEDFPDIEVKPRRPS